MARTKRDAKIDSRSARARLTARKEPYWTALAKGAYLGYRKGDQRGSWIARFRSEKNKQCYKCLGSADDLTEADGACVLSYVQAQQRAQLFFADQAAHIAGAPALNLKYRVADSINDYFQSYEKRSGKALDRMVSVARNHILPELGHVPIANLTKRQIETWRDKLVETPPRVRCGRDRQAQFKAPVDDADYLRRRRSSANRVLTIFKAALNRAFEMDIIKSDAAWTKIKPFRAVDVGRILYLRDDELVRLINSCEPDFRQLVIAAIMTGCRYGELTALRVCDFDHASGTILVSTSKSGKPRRVSLIDEGRDFFLSHTAGRTKNARIFTKPNEKPWNPSDQTRRFNVAAALAHIEGCTFHGLRHTYASRAIMGGAPLAAVARQLGHSDTRMVEKHYGHLAPNYVADVFRSAYKPLGIAGGQKLIPMKKGRFAA